ncbi:hypothetical protein [Haloterrigena alkaliphila]|uniref:Uncharacterized protein n=1 Tax=Haloterrigena alkaliphila TaxID=2816475 RepID=A0A8A2VIM3_9EURY|nr:hypothetical protein [Haloterrigena alkaliphila]QSX00235.1 hypothetical protein J0X25_04520 [Haloterrigena alkaliphila]
MKTLRKSLDRTVHPQPQTGRAFHVIDGGEEYRFATVQFATPGQNGSSVFLTWNDKDDEAIPNFVVTEYDSEDRLEKRTSIKDGEVVEYESSAENIPSPEAETDRDIGILYTADPDECVSYITEECTDVNWSCLAQIGVVYGSCATAVLLGSISGVIWCLASGGVSLWQVADDENCSLCDSSSLREVEICGAPSSP